jgi:methylthioribose-1-phosphate isomerase
VDSAAASLIAAGRVDAVVTGADRIAANGDAANKVGTLSLAVNAAHHGCALFAPCPCQQCITCKFMIPCLWNAT